MLLDTYIKNSRIPLRYLKDITIIPSKKDASVFSDLNSIKHNIKKFVDTGDNLLICSNSCGNGKTTVATKLLRAYLDEVKQYSFPGDTPGLFVNVNSFLNEKRMAISDKELAEEVRRIEKAILTARLVVFDDIADKSLSEYDLNMLYYWLEHRTSNLKSCIFTSNELPEQLKQTLNGKVYSRVVNYSQIKYITDGDHRSKIS